MGSLLRPEFLLTARKHLETGEIDAARFEEVEDRAVDEAVEVQTSAGSRSAPSAVSRRQWKATG